MVYSENLQKLVRGGRGVRGMVFSESKAGLNLRDSQLGIQGSVRRYLESGGSQKASGLSNGVCSCA